MPDLATAIVNQVRNKMVLESPAMIRECLDLLTDDQIWWRPNDTSNAIGNLIIHLCGATRHFLGRGVGGSKYVRDREAEFTTRVPLPKAELRRMMDETLAEAEQVLSKVSAANMFETTRDIGMDIPVVDCLLRMSHHWSLHTGQIMLITKQLRAGSVKDLTRRVMVK